MYFIALSGLIFKTQNWYSQTKLKIRLFKVTWVINLVRNSPFLFKTLLPWSWIDKKSFMLILIQLTYKRWVGITKLFVSWQLKNIEQLYLFYLKTYENYSLIIVELIRKLNLFESWFKKSIFFIYILFFIFLGSLKLLTRYES